MRKPSEIYNDARAAAVLNPSLGLPHSHALEVLANAVREDERRKIHGKLLKRTR